MPTYRVTIAEKTYTVEVPNIHERPVRAIVDGEVVEVHVDNVGASVPAPASVSAPAPVVASAPVPASTPVAAPAPIPTPAPVVAPTTAGAANVVKAPLPGTVVSIAVTEGDRVAVGQELCVLEAMKMNNPIRATQPGTVTQIHVRVGEQVMHGAPLVTLGS